MTIEQILEIVEKYKLRMPPTAFYELKADIVNFEEQTTKNNLGVDCISRQAVIDGIKEYFHDEYYQRTSIQDCRNCFIEDVLNHLPSVTPQEPISDILEDIYTEIEDEYEDCVIGKLDDDEMYPCFRKITDIYGVMDIIDKYKAEQE